MRRRNIWQPVNRRRNRLFKCLCIVIGLILVVALIDSQIRPVVENMCAYEAKVYANKIINNAMIEQMEQSGLTYTDIVQVSRNDAGEVTSIQTNVVAVNQLKTQMVDSVVTELESMNTQQPVMVPVGTLLGTQVTSGRGPVVEIQVIPTGYVQSEIYNQFISAGINQTLHQIMLKTSVQMIAIVPGYTVRTETTTNFCIAETVIVGGIPEGYTVINGDDSSTIAKINDYQAEQGR